MSKGLLSISFPGAISLETHQRLTDYVAAVAKDLDCEALILPDGGSVSHTPKGMDELIPAMIAYTDAVNRQTEMLTTILQALAEQEMGDDDDFQPSTYLDGTPC